MKDSTDDQASNFSFYSDSPYKGDDWYNHQTGFIKHHCTDVICCIFFSIALCGFLAVSVVAYMHGDLRRLYHGLDWESNVCGVDAATLDYTYVYWCRDPENGRLLAASHPRELTMHYNVGDRVMGQDVSGQLWPVTITKIHANGSYAGEVDDGYGTQWPVIYDNNLSPMAGEHYAGSSVAENPLRPYVPPPTPTPVVPPTPSPSLYTPSPPLYTPSPTSAPVVPPNPPPSDTGSYYAQQPSGLSDTASPPDTSNSEFQQTNGDSDAQPAASNDAGSAYTPSAQGQGVLRTDSKDSMELGADGFDIGPPPPPDTPIVYPSGPSTTTTTTPENPFVLTEDGTSCPYGYRIITSSARCVLAASSMYYAYDFQRVESSCVTPSGCVKYHNDNRVWFSTCPAGTPSPNFTMICEMETMPRCLQSETVNPAEDKRTYSSVWNNDTAGTGHAQSMLDSPQAWSSGNYTHNAIGEWMTMDLGKIKDIIGVVVEGRHSFNRQWITKLNVSSSTDGHTWNAVPKSLHASDEAGASREEKRVVHLPFVAEARYLKIAIVDFVGWRPALRTGALVCNEFNAPLSTPKPELVLQKAKLNVRGCEDPYNRSEVPCDELKFREEAEGVNLRHPVCVKACPDDSSTSVVCKQGQGSSFWDEEAYPTRPILGLYCMPKDHDIFLEMMASLCDHAFVNFMHKSALAFLETWPIMIVTTLSAMLVGYMYLFLLRSFAVSVITFTVTFLCIVYGGLALLLIVAGFLGGADGIKGSCDKWNDFSLGLLCLLICIALTVSACKYKKLMHKSASTMIVSFEAFFQCPALILEPMISTVIRLCWLASWTAGFLLILSMGKIQKEEVYRSFTLTYKEFLMMAYYVFMYIWISEFLTAWKCYVMTFILQRWFYQRGWTDHHQHVKPSLPCSVLCKAYETGCYHLGSLAMGGFLIPLLRPIRLIWRFTIFVISCCTKGKTSKKTQHCLGQYWNSVGFINKEGYSDVALFSVNYVPGTVHANRQVNHKRQEVGPLMGASYIVEIIGAALMILVGGAVMFLEMRSLMPFFERTQQFFAEDPVIPAVVAAILAAFLGGPIMLAFGEVADDLLYCYSMEDEVRRLYHEEGHGDGSSRGLLDCSGFERKPMQLDPQDVGQSPAWLRRWVHESEYDAEQLPAE